MYLTYSESGLQVQVQGADYRNTSGVLVPDDDRPSSAVPYHELLETEQRLRSQIELLQQQVAFLSSRLEAASASNDRREYFAINPVSLQVFTHNVGFDPSVVTVYDLNGRIISDAVCIEISQSGKAISIATEVPLAYRVVMRF